MTSHPETANRAPPLVVDRETNLCRPVTADDIRRWETMEVRYNHLLAILREAVNNAAR